MNWRAISVGVFSFIALTCPYVARAQLIDVAKATAGDAGFPSDWYVRDGEGLDELKALEGKPAQELSIDQWRGDSTTLAALKGKIVVLDFWATWCGPCMAAIPKNVELVNKYKDKGVTLIGVHDAKAGWEDVDQVISDKGINYPVALDKAEGDSGATTQAYALKFWPTYFVIDRNGILRGAAIKPDKVQEVVERLLTESPAPAGAMASKAAATPDNWFLGGSKRLKSLRDQEGKRAAALAVTSWLGAEPDQADWKGQVRVVQFVRPEIAASIDQLTKVQSVAERFARQGVVFVAVCDARSSRDKMKAIVEDKRIELPIAVDSPAADGGAPSGATAQALGIKFAPTTVVIDRAGKVRAAGLKPDFLDKVLNGLLAEPMPLATEEETGNPPADAAEAKPAETKPAETKPAEAKPAETKPAEAKPAEAKPVPATEAEPSGEKPLTAQRPDDGQPPAP